MLLGRSWLITGVCGTIGRRLLRKVMELEPARVVGIDNNETELFFLREDYRRDIRLRLFVCDLRDRQDLVSRFNGAELVLHAAAVKHVYLNEESPLAAIHSNVLGTQNVLDAALTTSIQRLILTSSDKAVNPTNVMGSSKLLAERLVTAANAQTSQNQIFSSTRFGNVLGSRGSVIPLFLRQIKDGGPITVTNADMTRFIMSTDEAVRLVVDSMFMAVGGEIFVTKMPVVRIGDLADTMIELFSKRYGFRPSDIAVETIGPRPGEKMYEELTNEEEAGRVVELERYYVVKPAVLSPFRELSYVYDGTMSTASLDRGYSSRHVKAMTKDEIGAYFLAHPDLMEG